MTEGEGLPGEQALGAQIPCPQWLRGSDPSGEGAGPCTNMGGGGPSKRPGRSFRRGIFTLHISILRSLNVGAFPSGFIFSPLVEGSRFVGAARPPSGNWVAWKDVTSSGVVLGREGPGLDSCTLGHVSCPLHASVSQLFVKWDQTCLPGSLCRLPAQKARDFPFFYDFPGCLRWRAPGVQL